MYQSSQSSRTYNFVGDVQLCFSLVFLYFAHHQPAELHTYLLYYIYKRKHVFTYFDLKNGENIESHLFLCDSRNLYQIIYFMTTASKASMHLPNWLSVNWNLTYQATVSKLTWFCLENGDVKHRVAGRKLINRTEDLFQTYYP